MDYLRGHSIEYDGEKMVYSDTKEMVSGNYPTTCGHCGLAETPEGHDGCLGTLEGIMNACCGHGGKHEGAYIQFWDRTCVRDEDALTIVEILKRNDGIE
ncbi:hypothetical protein [Salibacterium lacus]|uniref:Uncharacterized protein n=1 Tax=Salibacterium lacus TaxID=1898109 RepID=A0ABW5SYG6_9BACI